MESPSLDVFERHVDLAFGTGFVAEHCGAGLMMDSMMTNHSNSMRTKPKYHLSAVIGCVTFAAHKKWNWCFT